MPQTHKCAFLDTGDLCHGDEPCQYMLHQAIPGRVFCGKDQMTDCNKEPGTKKICPVMSRPGTFQIEPDKWVFCLQEKCMWWQKPCEAHYCDTCVYQDPEDPLECLGKTGYCRMATKGL